MLFKRLELERWAHLGRNVPASWITLAPPVIDCGDGFVSALSISRIIVDRLSREMARRLKLVRGWVEALNARFRKEGAYPFNDP
jgi:hypothetical protein